MIRRQHDEGLIEPYLPIDVREELTQELVLSQQDVYILSTVRPKSMTDDVGHGEAQSEKIWYVVGAQLLLFQDRMS